MTRGEYPSGHTDGTGDHDCGDWARGGASGRGKIVMGWPGLPAAPSPLPPATPRSYLARAANVLPVTTWHCLRQRRLTVAYQGIIAVGDGNKLVNLGNRR
jgi:hypothetical protein